MRILVSKLLNAYTVPSCPMTAVVGWACQKDEKEGNGPLTGLCAKCGCRYLTDSHDRADRGSVEADVAAINHNRL